MRTSSLTLPAQSPTGWLVWFSQGFGNPGVGGGGMGGGGMGGGMGGPTNPYAGSFGPQAPPPRRSSAWMWIVGGLGLGGLLLCGCCGGFFMFGMSQVETFLRQESEGHPAMAQHIGEIKSMSANLTKMGEESQKRGNGANVIVYDVKGTNGDGQLLGEQSRNPQPGGFFDKIDLRLPTGEEISIK